MSERNYGLTHLMENIEATRHSRPQSPLFFGLWCGAVVFVLFYAVGYFVARIAGWL